MQIFGASCLAEGATRSREARKMIREIAAIASDARIFPRFVYHPELQKICLPVPACSRGERNASNLFRGRRRNRWHGGIGRGGKGREAVVEAQ